MNNLYKKIYEAIDNGIQKALIINNGQIDDVSVKWHGKQIKGDLNQQIIVDNWVHNDLLMNKDLADYNDIINCNCKYTVKDIDELYTIIELTQNEPDFTVSWLDVSNIDLSHVSYILSDGSEINITDYKSGMSVVFVKISYVSIDPSFKFSDSIILHKDFLCNGYTEKVSKAATPHLIGMKWSKGIKRTFDDTYCIDNEYTAGCDYDGYNHTYDNPNIHKCNFSSYPAFEYATQFDINGYKGYLPSLGEYNIFFKNIELYIYALLNIGYRLNQTPFGMGLGAWTSTEANNKEAWNGMIYFGKQNLSNQSYFVGKMHFYDKRVKDCLARSGVIPFFKKAY